MHAFRLLYCVLLFALVASHATATLLRGSTVGRQAVMETSRQNSFDLCRVFDECISGLLCLGRLGGGDGDLTLCARTITECFCLPPTFIFCERSDECPDDEACAVNPKSGNQLCASCATISTTSRNFTAVDATATECAANAAGLSSPLPDVPDVPDVPTVTTSPSPAPRVAPGTSYDFCSPKLGCRPDYTCLSIRSTTDCTARSVLCACYAPQIKLCSQPQQCARGETCALDTVLNKLECVSCNLIRQQITQLPISSSVCDKIPRRPIPRYPPSPNGLALDACVSHLQCGSQLECRFSNGSECARDISGDQDDGALCACVPEEGHELQTCSGTDDCPVGETCVENALTNTLSALFGGVARCISMTAVSRADADVFTRIQVPPVALPEPAEGLGLTDDTCRFDWECAGSRRCTHVDGLFGGCAGRRACSCKDIRYKPCTRDLQCKDGDLCANVRGARSRARCESPRAIERDPDMLLVAELAAEKPSNTTVTSGGLTMDACRDNTDCEQPAIGTRICRHSYERNGECGGRQACICTRDQELRCESSTQCEDGEICAVIKDTVVYHPACRSRAGVMADAFQLYEEVVEVVELPSVEPDEEDEVDVSPVESDSTAPSVIAPSASREPDDLDDDNDEEGVCIDAQLLAHLHPHELIYAQARPARVLCDAHGTCATPGHVVLYNAVGMLMRTYCARHASPHARCVWRRRLVNSPRMRVGLRVASRSPRLQFSALAARFETDFEEMVLARLVHAGV